MRFVQNRDHSAFAEIVERHGGLVWLVCREVLQHHQDVEDAFQATFFILAERATSIRSNDSAAAWLYKVAQRTALAARRKRSFQRETTLTDDPLENDEPFSLIHDEHMIFVLMQELRELPHTYQVPLVMRYLEGRSRRAIADQTDSTLAQIQGRLVRGRRLLRTRLIRRGVSLSLAATAVAAANARAAVIISPAYAATTAKACIAVKTAGAVAGASVAALELAKQGAKAMWLASLAKTTAALSTVLVAAGIAWGVQANKDASSADGDAPTSASTTIELQPSAAVDTLAAATTGSPAAPQPGANAKYEWDWYATQPNAATLEAQLTERKKRVHERLATVDKELEARIHEKAVLATQLEMQELEKSVLRQQLEHAYTVLFEAEITYAADDSEAAQKKLAERLKALRERVAESREKLKLITQETAKLSATVELIELRTADARRRQQELQRLNLELDLSPRPEAAALTPNSTAFDDWVRQRLRESQSAAGSTETPDQWFQRLALDLTGVLPGLEERQAFLDDVQQRGPLAYKRVLERIVVSPRFGDPSARFWAGANVRPFSFPSDAPPVRPTEVIPLQAKKIAAEDAQRAASDQITNLYRAIEALMKKNADLTDQLAQVAARQDAAPVAVRVDEPLKPGDTVRVEIANADIDAPVKTDFVIESTGTVALGPQYGRINIEGKSVLDAERAIKEELSKTYKSPQVQVTRGTSAKSAEQLAPNTFKATNSQVPQLNLERQSWRLKAEAYRLKAQQLQHAGDKDGVMTNAEKSNAKAESLLMEADANHAEAMALEIDKQLEELQIPNSHQPSRRSETRESKK
jgi:RNA polymerase sigma factor (sigma-70 family)